MARSMNTMPTARQGRTYYKQGANDQRGLSGFCSVFLMIVLLVAPPLLLVGSERGRYTRYVALSDAFDSDIIELNGASAKKDTANIEPGSLVHGTSNFIDTASSDDEMGVQIPGALTLKRNAEYCQWQELVSNRCETCTRVAKAKDGSSKEESYQCNCVREYNYVKAWRNHRINSMMFDQPGAHHNPTRDPMPSRTFVGDETKLIFPEGSLDTIETHRHPNKGGLEAKLDSTMLSNGVRGQPYRRVEFVPDGRAPPPSFFSKLFSWLGPIRRTRYEPLQMLRETPHSHAAVNENFVYVGQGGYFFSPYEASRSGKLFNLFTQYLEGSLFDWQLGDILPSCTAGDVRFFYEVQNPTVVSVLGQVDKRNANHLAIIPRTLNGIGDRKAATIGLVHEGAHSAEMMLIAEDQDSKNQAQLVRLLILLWSIPASRLVGLSLGREMSDSSAVVQAEGVLGLFLTLLSATWLVIWNESMGSRETALAFAMGATFTYLALKSASKSSRGGRANAVWCRVLRWANAPPEWRVEDSYIPAPIPKVGPSAGKQS